MAASTADRTPAAFRRGTRDASPVAGAAIASWGAGLIQLALGAGALTAGEFLVGVPLVALGAAALAWGAAALAKGRVVLPRTTLAGVLAGLVVGAVALSTDPERTSVVAVSAGWMLLLGAGIGCGLAIRRGDAGRPRMPGLIVAAVIVAAIVTPALAATEAGRLAPDHSVHELVGTGHVH
ncbi:hypothetical protein AAIB33_12720 [Microbacterium sp. AZCO]|uniref:hypothetical protein n=1 Tax=Microbacterium sp. AZCO TaxID=3142976 RepID=UPI0031F3F93E